ncbi:ribosome assembly RNA-binding protein YhbY [Melissococcus plutonius]|uniref:RNA binding protein n=2 Tax=Melissococcus plutonius TaxID=33970 RepID=F3Y972_MELPT|nr:ribosome assembly RNA-binding protein YhbY [Melissococcus plutonius]BAL62547.1 RNA binding protein [Melissococcus plutonius DAT561]AIM24633.1 RNA binding protein [Melissococcus plutonius S1]KMT27610.1 RNA binding protein [Melissococcus plutonius]KMT29383.1 RNA binding protein [Melissococcus plutonius]KMT31425.1 RNA binding protein [Melissococcus plutonius]
MELRGKQKRFLRSNANHLQPIFQIGKGGLNKEMINQMNEALEKKELIKISLLQNTNEITEDVAQTLEASINCNVVQIIGRVLVLFKPSTKEKYQNLSRKVSSL